MNKKDLRKVVIYFTADKKSFQIIQPTEAFAGDWQGLVEAVTRGKYHSYILL